MGMVERVCGESDPRGAAAYAGYFQRVVLAELAAVEGYIGARVWQREIEGMTEIVVVTEWESLEAISGLAGDDIDQAVVHDEAASLRTDYERTVRHYEIVMKASAWSEPLSVMPYHGSGKV